MSGINEDVGKPMELLFFKELNGMLSDSLNDQSKVATPSLAWWAQGELVFLDYVIFLC